MYSAESRRDLKWVVLNLQSWGMRFSWDDQQQLIQIIRHKRLDIDSNNMVLWRLNGGQMQTRRAACFVFFPESRTVDEWTSSVVTPH